VKQVIDIDYQFEDIDLRAAADKLGERDRKILVMHMQGYTGTEIGKKFGIKKSRVSQILRRIKQDLKTALYD